MQFTVTGEPAAIGCCHCESCRHWSAGPVKAFTLWEPEALEITQDAGDVGSYSKTSMSFRKWCKNCGGHLYGEHPPLGLIDVFVAVIPSLKRQSAVHVNDSEKVLAVKDRLPKLKDFPSEMGGSGQSIPE